MEIWVNPRCSKCRTATAALDEAGVEYVVRRYLDDPPTVDELTAVIDRLGLEPWDVVRSGEAAATEAGLDTLPKDAAHRGDWIAAMVAHPILIQRPIITTDDGTTVVARDAETLRQVL
ncbi:MAG: arsenate reductase [Propionibacteriales bacterium]|nr:arsenate reductase [Propionibacteriales bacterium]